MMPHYSPIEKLIEVGALHLALSTHFNDSVRRLDPMRRSSPRVGAFVAPLTNMHFGEYVF